MKRPVSRVLLTLLCCALFLPLLLGTAGADDTRSYAIDAADFVIRLNDDGSADITETWTVRFISGSFTRFYKDICNRSYLTAAEKFGSVQDLHVYINGTECTYTNDTNGRPDYTYHASQGTNGYTVEWYKASKNVTRTYVMTYTLPDIIKYVSDAETPYYYFSYRCIGENLDKTVGSITAAVIAPEACSMRALSKSHGRASAESDRVVFTSGSYNGLYKICVRMDDIEIPGAAKIHAADIESPGAAKIHNTFSVRRMIPFSVTGILCLAVITPIIIKKFGPKIRSRYIKHLLKKDPDIVYTRLQSWFPYGTPLEIGAAFSRSHLLPAAILEAIHNGILKYQSHSQTLIYPAAAKKQDISEMTKEELIFYFLDRCCMLADIPQKNNDADTADTHSITVKTICNVIKYSYNAELCVTVTRALYRVIGHAKTKRKNEDTLWNNRLHRKDRKFFSSVLPEFCPVPPSANAVLQSGCDYLPMLEYMLIQPKGPGNGLGALTYYTSQAYLMIHSGLPAPDSSTSHSRSTSHSGFEGGSNGCEGGGIGCGGGGGGCGGGGGGCGGGGAD